eukprot:gb/GECG01003304.1/.p1 GENE.gb/GECG01003304.1/~~gb/GECG01003304.1/.p1  ORF type:complete len:463 (+),score=36.16 gb/GECG01003304.1/:1-1389(+)
MVSSISTHRLLEWIRSPEDASQKVVVVDIRPQAEYNGWTSVKGRRGHILSARNLPCSWILDNEFKLNRSLSEVGNILKDKKITRDKTVVVYGSSTRHEEWNAVINLLSTQLSYLYIYSYTPGIEKWAENSDLPMEHLPNYQCLVPSEVLKQLIETGNAPTFGGKKWKIFEVSWRSSHYSTGHIPTAHCMHTDNLEEPPMWNKKQDDVLERELLALGIASYTTVILYDRENLSAARAALIMLYAGVRDVRILDGGIKHWRQQGYPLETAPNPSCPKQSFGVKVPRCPEIICDRWEVKQLLEDGDANLISIRTWQEYIGKTSGYSYIRAKGCIPGSVWGHGGSSTYRIEHFRNPDNTFRSYKEIRDLWEDWGIESWHNNCFFCGTGWRAAEAFFSAMLMGWGSISVYDGGWLEWSTYEVHEEYFPGARRKVERSTCEEEVRLEGSKFRCDQFTGTRPILLAEEM